ncbi:MAG: hypothetical protein ACPGXK_14755, partial [Phycisphaerae bacterium]
MKRSTDMIDRTPGKILSIAASLVVACLIGQSTRASEKLPDQHRPQQLAQANQRTDTDKTPPAPKETAPSDKPAEQTETPANLETEVAASLSKQDLVNRLATVEAATDLSEEMKAEAMGLYRQAIALLDQAEAWRVKAANYRRGIEETPALLENVKKTSEASKLAVEEDDTPKEEL